MAADVAGTPSALTVGGAAGLEDGGVPIHVLEMKFENINPISKNGNTELDFRSVSKTFLFDVRLRFRPGSRPPINSRRTIGCGLTIQRSWSCLRDRDVYRTG